MAQNIQNIFLLFNVRKICSYGPSFTSDIIKLFCCFWLWSVWLVIYQIYETLTISSCWFYCFFLFFISILINLLLALLFVSRSYFGFNLFLKKSFWRLKFRQLIQDNYYFFKHLCQQFSILSSSWHTETIAKILQHTIKYIIFFANLTKKLGIILIYSHRCLLLCWLLSFFYLTI